jgi:predicted regulator of Ras-like GTPase activity (Roadblock/LC7/MglB family)/regulator of replication initiation timing
MNTIIMSTNTDRRVKHFLYDFRQNNPGILSLAVFSDLGVVISEGADFNRNEFRIAQISSILVSTASRKEVEDNLGELVYSITAGVNGTLILYSVPRNYSIFLKMTPQFGDFNLLLYRLKVLALKLKHVFEQQKIVDPIDNGISEEKILAEPILNEEEIIQGPELQPETISYDSIQKKEERSLDQQIENAKKDIQQIMKDKMAEKIDEVVYEHMKLRVENSLLKQKLKELGASKGETEDWQIIKVDEELNKALDDARNVLLNFAKELIIKK